MKRMLILLAVFALLLAAGCGPAAEPPAIADAVGQQTEAEQATDAAEEIKEEDPVKEEFAEEELTEEELTEEEPTEEEPTEEEPTEEEPAEEEPSLPYLEQIDWADQSVFAEPSYDSVFVGTVELAGTYTIVEEAYDEEGNLWGKLKSGMGWVDLTDIRSEARKNVPVSANFAEERLLASGNYHSYVPAEAEYALRIAFRTRETLRNVTLCSMVLNETMEPADVLFSLEELTAEKPLVAELTFPGDMSCYGLRFTDAAGAERFFILSISGRNGMVCLTESEL